MENPQREQPKSPRPIRHSRNHLRSHPNHQRGRQQKFYSNNSNDDDDNNNKKNGNRHGRFGKKLTHNCRRNDQGDGSVNGSVSTSSSGSTNSRNSMRKKLNKNEKCYNHQDRIRRDGYHNSLALNRYLQERDWPLSDEITLNNYPGNPNDVLALVPYVRTNTPTISRESERVRKRALKLLENTLCRWASLIEKKATVWQRARVTLITFGSYRLRAYKPDADVDLLALCPPSCTREDFFTSLVEMMEKEKAIDDIHPIASAYTPVIKFTIHNIHFDMLFGRVSGKANIEKLILYQRQTSSPFIATGMQRGKKTGAVGVTSQADAFRGKGDLVSENKTQTTNYRNEGTITDVLHEFTIEDSFLTGMEDESEVRSANGVRVTQFIMNYVPNPDSFRVVLCAVKEWAMTHGIYSNVLGFMGGVNWAIMVAWVCKQFPRHQPSTLLRTFFQVFATWNWPAPVLLENTTNEITAGIAVEGMKNWDPTTNPRDARHVMPIITPVFPRMNSTYNIAIPQQRRIQEELIRAAFLIQNESNWRALYYPSDFFERHANFLEITIRAGNNHADFTKWLGLCESRLRLLVNALDCQEMSVWPFAQIMKRNFPKPNSNHATSKKMDPESTIPEALFFIALRFAPNVESIDLKHHTSEFLINQINSWDGRKPDMDFMIHHVLQKDLPHELIGKYTTIKSSVLQEPNSLSYKPAPTSNTTQSESKRSTTPPTITNAYTKSKQSKTSPVPKDIQAPSGCDSQSVARSTYSSIARSFNSSMRSEDGTETSFDGIECESRPHSPLGNFITVEGLPPTPTANEGKKKEHTMQGLSNRDDESEKPYSRQTHLYDFLIGKTDDMLPCVASADDYCTQSIAAESQSDQSSTRSPIKKRPRNNTRTGSKDSE